MGKRGDWPIRVEENFLGLRTQSPSLQHPPSISNQGASDSSRACETICSWACPGVSDSVDLVWGPRMCVSSKCPSETAAASLGTPHWEPLLQGSQLQGELPKELVPSLASEVDSVWAGLPRVPAQQ